MPCTIALDVNLLSTLHIFLHFTPDRRISKFSLQMVNDFAKLPTFRRSFWEFFFKEYFARLKDLVELIGQLRRDSNLFEKF